MKKAGNRTARDGIDASNFLYSEEGEEWEQEKGEVTEYRWGF